MKTQPREAMLLQLENKVRTLRRDGTAPENGVALAEALEQLAGVHLDVGQLLEAKRSLLEAVDVVRPRAALDDASAKSHLADLQIKLGYLFCSLEEPAAALGHFDGAVGYFESGADNQRGLAAALNGLASAHGMLDDSRAAIECLTKAAAITGRIAMSSRQSADAAQWAMLLNNLGRAQIAAKDTSSAMAVMERCVEITEELLRVSQSPDHRNLRAAALCRLGSVHEAAGDAAKARDCYRPSVGDMRHLVEDLGMRQFANDYAYAVECLKRLDDGGAG